jgi:hypothetical protein
MKILNAAPRPNYANMKSYLKSRRLLARVRTSKRKEIIQRMDTIIENDDYFSQLMEKLELDDDTAATEAIFDSFSSLSDSSFSDSFSSLSDSSFSPSEEDDQKQVHHAVWVWSSGNLQEEADWPELQETAFGGVALIKNSSGRVPMEDETMLPGVNS